MFGHWPPKPIRAWAGSDFHRKLIEDPEWTVDGKIAGKTCIVLIGNGKVELWSRHGHQFTEDYLLPIIKALSRLDAGTILYAELKVAKALPGQSPTKADLWLIDVPKLRGYDLSERTLRKRRPLLRALYHEFKGVRCIRRTPVFRNKATAYQRALVMGLEGVVWKRWSSQFLWQRGPQDARLPIG